MNVMTKRGSLDNVITYEHFCDAKSDLANIPKNQITLGSVAIVLKDENDSLGVYIADSSKTWISAMISAGGSGGSTNVDLISICTSEEYDSSTGLPTIENPEENKLYLVPNNGDNNNLFNEWIWTGEEWEQFGGGAGSVAIAQSDWNQNDSTAPDYIKNRICYVANTIRNTIVDDDYSLTGTLYNSTYYYEIDFDPTILFDQNISETNKMLVVIQIDDQQYDLNICYTSQIYVNGNVISGYIITSSNQNSENLFLQLGLDNEGYLRKISWQNNMTMDGTHHISIYKNNEQYVTIPTKYLPNWPYISKNEMYQIIFSGTGQYSRALSSSTNDASGDYSISEGQSTTASGCYSHAEGWRTTASGIASHAEGKSTIASAECAHAEGRGTEAAGNFSHGEGRDTKARGMYSHSEGYYTTAKHRAQHVFGEYNIVDTSENASYDRGNYVEIVGNGTEFNALSNARTLDWNGNEWLAGNLTLNQTTLTENDLIQLLASRTIEINIPDTDVIINANPNTRYVCGEVSTLDFTPSATGICDIKFTSGSSKTILTLPSTVKMPDWFEVEANTIYEINIEDGVYGVVASWPM